jgi:hypothetical protein
MGQRKGRKIRDLWGRARGELYMGRLNQQMVLQSDLPDLFLVTDLPPSTLT